jgi:hypothetical protein
MFDYDSERFRSLLTELTRTNINEEAWSWLSDRFLSLDTMAINSAFAMMPRKTVKSPIIISVAQEAEIERL